MNRFLSALLALVTFCGTAVSLSGVSVYAAATTTAAAAATTKAGATTTAKAGATTTAKAGAAGAKTTSTGEEIIDYYTKKYASPDEKLADMDLKVSAYGYELYYESYSGEVALRNTKSGQVLFSNPYDLATTSESASADTKNQLLSQIIIKYMDNDQEKPYYSFVEAAQREQIKVKNLKNGIRVEYTIGKEETRNLVPRMIEKSRFENNILANIDDEQALKKMNAFYTLKDPADSKLTVRGVKELQATFPITKKMAVYVFDPYASTREVNLIEAYIKQFCPQYTFADLDEDHAITEYQGSSTAPALFKMSLEYYVNEDGLQVRLPANGIRFNEDSYQLTYIQILPYMGAGCYSNNGYTFIPDGSGTIVRFEDFAGQNLTVSGKLYGQDYAFHEISGAHQQAMRMPVYGVVENYKGSYEKEVAVPASSASTSAAAAAATTAAATTAAGEAAAPATEKVKVDVTEDRGFLAIITEGDALANITTSHGGAVHKYATVYTQFYPRPKDSYNLREAVSVGANATWTVVSKRKYTGSYRLQYIMLTDANIAKEKKISNFYEVSWTGMAKAYRDYLVKKGDLTAIKETKADIPLYIETLGVIDTKEVILSIPVIVKTPLTTFDDLKTMYGDLSAAGISNIIYRLTGFTNGGIIHTMPTKVKFEKKVGGNKGYTDFLSFAKTNNIGVYPDFDFAYVQKISSFDGFSYRTDAVKTIDDRYTQRRTYDPIWQTFYRDGMVAVSPSVFQKLYGKFTSNYDKLGSNGISISTLGSDLNSDFDKKDPYNREDSKEFTVKLLKEMYDDYGGLMIDNGNAYTLKYASHILNVSLNSSQYYYSSQSVPFVGMVLHGYVPFAGTPTNMAGDINYEILKIIENGASPYFILCYRNIAELKDYSYMSSYYSISYEIWFDDLVKKYDIINEALKGVQTATISGHEFLAEAERIPSAEELAADKAEAKAAADAEAEAKAEEAANEERAKKLEERLKAEAKAAALAKGETVAEEPAETTAETETAAVEETAEEGYVPNKYTCALGSVVKVTYSNGTSFILNYNSYQIKVDGKTVEPLGFIKIGK